MLRLAALGLGLIHTRSGGQPKPGASSGLPALHLDHPVIDVELEVVDEPAAELAQRQAVAHRHRPGADEALPARAQRQPFDRPPGGIGPVEHPHALAVLGRGFEHVEQRRDEGVDPAAEVLQVDQDRVERAHRLAGRAAHLAVEAEHRDAVDGIGEVVGDSTILSCLSPRSAVLRPERGGDVDARPRPARRGCGSGRAVTDAGWASSATRLPSSGRRSSGSASSRSIPNRVMARCLRKPRGEASGVVEVGLVAGGWASAQ